MRALSTVLALVVSLQAVTGQPAEVMTTVRVFHLRDARVSIREATAAVLPLVSENGTLTVQPHQRQLILQDRPEVVAKVDALLEEMSRAPDHYRIRVELLEASNSPLPPEQRAQVDARVSRMFHLSSFRRLGVTVLEGEVGQPGVAHLGESHKVRFVTNQLPSSADAPWGFANPGPRVHLDPLTLVSSRVNRDGVQRETEVLRTSVVLASGQRAIFGASASEGSDRALVLILEAQPAERR